MGLKVTWGTVLIGLVGPGKHAPLLSLAQVREIAEWQLTAELPEGETVAMLAGLDDGDGSEHESLVRKLAGAGGFDEGVEERKWRLVLLAEQLDALPEDVIARALALTDFWERFDYPTDSPHTVQGRGNRLDPLEYFTSSRVGELVARHAAWVEAERSRLRDSDSGSPLRVTNHG